MVWESVMIYIIIIKIHDKVQLAFYKINVVV